MAQTSLALVGVNSSLTAALYPYTLRSQNGNAIQYVGTSANLSLAAPELLDVKFTLKQPGVIGSDRVNCNFRKVVLNEDTSVPSTGSTSVQISIPRDEAWQKWMTVSQLKQAAHYLAGVAATIEGATDTSGFPSEWAGLIFP